VVIGDRGSLSLPDALLLVPPAGGRLQTLYKAPPGYALLDVAWDRGGRRVAVSEYRPGNGGSDRIRVVERDSGLATTVLDDFGQISFLDWAPHREELAFAGASLSGESGIFTYGLSPSGAIATPSPLILQTSGSRPSYSPDGSHLVFQRRSSLQRWTSIHTVDLNSGEERLIAQRGMAPSWSRETFVDAGAHAGKLESERSSFTAPSA
jgi:Tol biopolymer transport system component